MHAMSFVLCCVAEVLVAEWSFTYSSRCCWTWWMLIIDHLPTCQCVLLNLWWASCHPRVLLAGFHPMWPEASSSPIVCISSIYGQVPSRVLPNALRCLFFLLSAFLHSAFCTSLLMKHQAEIIFMQKNCLLMAELKESPFFSAWWQVASSPVGHSCPLDSEEQSSSAAAVNFTVDKTYFLTLLTRIAQGVEREEICFHKCSAHRSCWGAIFSS